tara:strand:+ start:6851 stop:8263 length:1413 start_codon:yes stop_codon:yes gene_type:complete
MSGALLQLVAVGAQDKLFTSNPEITFFALKHRSYSNFAVESIDQTINGTAGFGRTVSCTVSRNGDLVSRVAVEVKLPEIDAAGCAFVPNFASHLIESADIEIGGQRIDRHYGKWMHIWNELSAPASQATGRDRMMGNTAEFTNARHGATAVDTSAVDTAVTNYDGDVAATVEALELARADLYFRQRGNVPQTKIAGGTVTVPLQFWFCRHPGLALPLIALQYHEVKINVTFSKLAPLLRKWDAATGTYGSPGTVTEPSSFDVKVWVDYVYLDNEERRRMAQQPHQYLIDQLQHSGQETVRSKSDRYKLQFNHPVKELVWVVNSKKNNVGVYSYPEASRIDATNARCIGSGLLSTGRTPVASAKLVLNGHDRFETRDGSYFDSVQPSQHHTNTPSPGINVFSFALKPEEFQPSGTCNFSRVDNASLEVDFHKYSTTGDDGAFWADATVDIFATNYNQLRIMSGMGGLTYSN